jgi:hypothetical protein
MFHPPRLTALPSVPVVSISEDADRVGPACEPIARFANDGPECDSTAARSRRRSEEQKHLFSVSWHHRKACGCREGIGGALRLAHGAPAQRHRAFVLPRLGHSAPGRSASGIWGILRSPPRQNRVSAIPFALGPSLQPFAPSPLKLASRNWKPTMLSQPSRLPPDPCDGHGL